MIEYISKNGTKYKISVSRGAFGFVAEIYYDYGPGHVYDRDDILITVESRTAAGAENFAKRQIEAGLAY